MSQWIWFFNWIWKMGRICLYNCQKKKISQVTKKQKYKSKKAQSTFGDSKLTDSARATVSLKNLRGNKTGKVD